MTNNYYQLYREKVLQLAETIRIKSEATATAMNQAIVEIEGTMAVEDNAPETWKYYMNLAGEYHWTDEMMEVISIDTLEKIYFTKENLQVHRATLRDYQFGSTYYKELVSNYPEQEDLILGILYPVDKATAIAAKDATILGYPSQLVEENEYSLMEKLQAVVYGYKDRWDNKPFALSDDLYPAYNLGILAMLLIQAIFVYRREACLTTEAHSFHVRMFLGSHGYLDNYIDSLTTAQALWLYKNIRYVERHAGKQDTFHWLVENLMTVRNLPLAEYTMRHNLSEQPEEIYPRLTFKRSPVNLGYNEDAQDTISLTELLDKEQTIAPGNINYQADFGTQIQELMENSLSNVVQTKALESNMFDRTDYTPYTMSDILLNHWLYLASENRYTAVVSVTNPKSGERMPMTAREAYVAMFYSYARAMGVDLTMEKIPALVAKRVQRIPRPTVDDLMSVVNPKYLDRSYAELALSYSPIMGSVISTEAFYNLCSDLFDAAQLQRKLVAFQQHHKSRGFAHGMISRIYCDKVCVLEDSDITFDEFFASRNFKLVDISENDHALLYLDLVKAATGLNLTSGKALKDLQKAMVNLLSQLSSYSIQILTTINQSSIKVIDWPVIRLGDVLGQGHHRVTALDEVAYLKDVKGRGKHTLKFDTSEMGPQLCMHAHSSHNANWDLTVRIRGEGVATRGYVRMLGAPIYITPPEPPQVNLGEVANKALQDFSYLTVAERQNMVDIYSATAGEP